MVDSSGSSNLQPSNISLRPCAGLRYHHRNHGCKLPDDSRLQVCKMLTGGRPTLCLGPEPGAKAAQLLHCWPHGPWAGRNGDSFVSLSTDNDLSEALWPTASEFFCKLQPTVWLGHAFIEKRHDLLRHASGAKCAGSCNLPTQCTVERQQLSVLRQC